MAFKVFLLWCFILLGRPQDLLPFLQPVRPALTLAALTLALTFIDKSSFNLQRVLSLKETKFYNLFFAAMVIGIPFAYHRRVAFDTIFTVNLSNIIFFYLSIMLVDSFERLKRFIGVIIISTLFYALFTIALGTFIGGRFQTFGMMYDPNDIAYVLVSLFPLSFLYIINRDSLLKTLVGLATLVTSVGVILLSASRAGLLSLITVLALVLLTRTSGIKATYKLIFLGSVVAIVILYGGSINFERLTTLTRIGADYNVTEDFGRLEIWGKGIKLFLINPLTGVGVNCFPLAIGYLRDELGMIPQWQAIHNSYMQVLVETGLAGTFFFVAMIFSSMKNFIRHSRAAFGSAAASEIRTISGLLAIGFAAHLVSAFFLTQAYSIFFALFFSASAVLKKLDIKELVEIRKVGAPLPHTKSISQGL